MTDIIDLAELNKHHPAIIGIEIIVSAFFIFLIGIAFEIIVCSSFRNKISLNLARILFFPPVIGLFLVVAFELFRSINDITEFFIKLLIIALFFYVPFFIDLFSDLPKGNSWLLNILSIIYDLSGILLGYKNEKTYRKNLENLNNKWKP